MKVQEGILKTSQWNFENILFFGPEYAYNIKEMKALKNMDWETMGGRKIGTKKSALVLQVYFQKTQRK